MTIHSIIWQHGDSETLFDAGQWPVVVGTVSSSAIRIPGPGGQTLAQIDVIEGKPFIQPLLRPSPLEVDGIALAATVPLRDGQVITAWGVDLAISLEADALHVRQHSAASRFETVAPIAGAIADDDAPIVAEAWQPSTESAPVATSRRGVLIAVGAGLALLAGAGLWLTTAVPLRLETVPAVPDRVQIDGPGISVPIGERWLLRPGVHTITLQSDGYRPLTRSIEVDPTLGTLVLEQQPLPGDLDVVADVAAAEGNVTLSTSDGSNYTQSLPARFTGLAPGDYELTVEAERYLTWQDRVAVTGLGRTQRLEIDLIAASGNVQVATQPPGARVIALSDNQLLAATTPAAIQLPTGQHRLLYQLDGYKPVERRYEVFANATDTAAVVELEPADASLRVTSRPAGASVTLNGRFSGRTPLTLALEPARRHDVRLSSPGYASVTREVTLASAQQRDLSINLAARLGQLTIRTVPADAEILINGRVAGSGTLEIELPSEPQRIAVRKEGYESWERTVTPRPGFSQTVDARLLTEADAALAKIDRDLTATNGHELKYFRGGTFRQGTSRREPDRRANEPLHDVRITRPYYLALKEVTNRQFAAFRRGHAAGADVYPSLAGNDNPVVNVSWQDAAAYCNWLSERDGLTPAYQGEFGTLVPAAPATNGYRLPTEAEWVWAARYGGRSGAPARYGWGDDMPPPDETVNLADETSSDLVSNILNGYRDGFPATAPVGSFAPAASGLYDLDGNVAEWLHDFYASSPSSDGPQIDPTGPSRGTDHVIRGAGWRDANATRLRFAYRDFGTDARLDVGFRIARFAD
ncbi:MAG: PEGA domain-containing protein [Pseudomonadota bacterium]